MPYTKDSYQHTIDHKGRVSLPAKFRKANSSTHYDTYKITVGLEGCLAVYSMDEWEKFLERLGSLHSNPSDVRFYQRMIFFNACESQLDKQGRITIPQELLAKAKIEKDVQIIKMMDRIELWNPNSFQEYLEKKKKTIEEIVEEVGG